MKWLKFALVTAGIWGTGILLLGINAMSECLPPFAAGFDECMSDKRRDGIIIASATFGLWLWSVFLIFRKRQPA